MSSRDGPGNPGETVGSETNKPLSQGYGCCRPQVNREEVMKLDILMTVALI